MAGRDNGTTLSKIDDSLSETYSESDRSRMRHNKGFIQQMLISSKLLLCNLPLSFSAISFSIVLLGMVWLKYAQENLPSCKEVSFHSSQCTFPEFPGERVGNYNTISLLVLILSHLLVSNQGVTSAMNTIQGIISRYDSTKCVRTSRVHRY